MNFVQTILTVVCSVVASSGFWSWVSHRHENKDAKTEMLLGLGHDRIMQEGMEYINRGYITPDEYENLKTYLWEPYSKLGGNGSAKRIMDEVEKLEIRDH